MPHRRLQDEKGRWWDVWDTRPTIIDRRAGRERRTGKRAGDRRQKSEPRVAVEPEFRKGWLAFQSGTDWRRLGPIPDAWDSLSDRELLVLLSRAGADARQRA